MKRPLLTTGGWNAGRLLGVPLRLQPSTLIVSALTLAVWAHAFGGFLREDAPAFVGYAFALAAYVGLIVCLTIHEFAHVLVARVHGVGCHHVTLTPFGMLAALEREPADPREEALVAAAGPLANVALAIPFWLMQDLPGLTGLLCYILFLANLGLALFNLVPCFPMDGGRILRAAAWAWSGDRIRATALAAGVGRIAGLVIVGYGIYQVYLGNPLGLLTALIAIAMVGAASRLMTQMRREARVAGQTAGSLMQPFGDARGTSGLRVTLAEPAEGIGAERGVELWRGCGIERVGVLPASAIASVRPEATVVEMMEAFTGGPRSGWPILLVGEDRPLGFVTQGQLKALID